jgi:hypothetical protein
MSANDKTGPVGEHTKLPWKFTPIPGATYSMIAGEGQVVAGIPNEDWDPESNAVNQANARLIVQAVNSHGLAVKLAEAVVGPYSMTRKYLSDLAEQFLAAMKPE